MKRLEQLTAARRSMATQRYAQAPVVEELKARLEDEDKLLQKLIHDADTMQAKIQQLMATINGAHVTDKRAGEAPGGSRRSSRRWTAPRRNYPRTRNTFNTWREQQRQASVPRL